MKNIYDEKFGETYDKLGITKRFEDRVWLKNKLEDYCKKSTIESSYNSIAKYGDNWDDSTIWFALMQKRRYNQRNYSISVENWRKCREVW